MQKEQNTEIIRMDITLSEESHLKNIKTALTIATTEALVYRGWKKEEL